MSEPNEKVENLSKEELEFYLSKEELEFWKKASEDLSSAYYSALSEDLSSAYYSALEETLIYGRGFIVVLKNGKAYHIPLERVIKYAEGIKKFLHKK